MSGKGSAHARGIVKDDRLVTTNYSSDVTRGDEKSDMTMMLADGTSRR